MTSLRDEVTESIPPGDDFYNYVNQKWLASHPIAPEKTRSSAFTELDETVTAQLHELLKSAAHDDEHSASLAKRFFQSGMDIETIESRGLEPIRPVIDEVAALATIDDVKALIIKRHSQGRSLVWSLGLDVDEKNSQRYVMELSQAGLLLPDRDYYTESAERFVTIRSQYIEFLERFFTTLELNNPAARAANVLAIETKLAEVSNTSIENRDVEAKYNPYTIHKLSDSFSGFNWQQYITDTQLSALDQLLVQQPKFISGALAVIDESSIESLRDYLLAQSVVPYLKYLSSKYDQLQFDFFGTTLTGTKKQEDRYKRIIKTTMGLLPEPVGQLYVSQHFDENAKAAITDLVTHIQQAMRMRIKKLDWMSDKTKQKAYEKLDTFMPLLGYPDNWRSYDSVTLTDNFVENILALRAHEWQFDVERVTKPVDRHEWLMSPALINAYYWPNTNGITFPAAILQPPFFDATGDFAANYGAIGVVIGHEITHGFDDKGSMYDPIGNLNSWWTDADRKLFDERAGELSRQYDAYEIDGQHVKGALTLGENIADLGGVLIAYDALQQKLSESDSTHPIDGFTPEQRFFMSYARIWRTNMRPEMALQLLVSDPHSPAHLRVNGILPNVDSWYEAFDIQEGALYKPPTDRIHIW